MHRPERAVEPNCSIFRDRPLLVTVSIGVIVVASSINIAVAAGYDFGSAAGGEQTSEREARVAIVHCRSLTLTHISRVGGRGNIGLVSLGA